MSYIADSPCSAFFVKIEEAELQLKEGYLWLQLVALAFGFPAHPMG
jgi:hypothetical protein